MLNLCRSRKNLSDIVEEDIYLINEQARGIENGQDHVIPGKWGTYLNDCFDVFTFFGVHADTFGSIQILSTRRWKNGWKEIFRKFIFEKKTDVEILFRKGNIFVSVKILSSRVFTFQHGLKFDIAKKFFGGGLYRLRNSESIPSSTGAYWHTHTHTLRTWIV